MKGKIWRRFLKFSTLFVVISALLISVAFTALTQTAQATLLSTVQGKVVSVNASQLSFEIQNGTPAPVTITTDTNTKFYSVPMGRVQTFVNNQTNQDIKQDQGKETRAGALKELHIPANWRSNLGWLDTFNTKAQFSDIQTDNRVIARVNPNYLALQVLIIKSAAVQSVKGTISAVSANSTTIAFPPVNPDNSITLSITDNTRITLKGLVSVQEGQYAVAVYNKNTLVAQTINVQATAPAPPPIGTLKSIAVNSAVFGNLSIGASRQFAATGTYANGSTQDITSQVNWASSNSGIASISNMGLATAGTTAGTTNITASKNGITSPALILTVGP